MSTRTFTYQMAMSILAGETHSLRFEEFCGELFSLVDGEPYVPTSASWDLGVDARGAFLENTPPLICSSLRKDIGAKASGDLERLSETKKPKRLRFCTSQPISEKGLDGLRNELMKLCPSLETVRAEGARQIVSLALQHPEPFERRYAGELAELKTALSTASDRTDEAEISGMRLALTTQLTPDAQSFRRELLTNMALTALSKRTRMTAFLIAKSVSDELRLGRIIEASYFHDVLKTMSSAGWIRPDGDGFVISDAGRERVAAMTDRGSENRTEGRTRFETALAKLTGIELNKTELNRIWKIVEESVSSMFFENGVQIAQALSSVLSNDSTVGSWTDLSTGIEKLKERVQSLQLRAADEWDDIAQAVEDIFKDRASAAFEWLGEVALAYVAICSLGLAPAAQEQIQNRLMSMELILDTDIVLSLLSAGEATHQAIKDFVRIWTGIGGTIYVTPPVLEEVAYHAFHAEAELNEVWSQLHKYNELEVRRLIENCFVRGFVSVAKQPYKRTHWGTYISNFRGQKEYDYSVVADELKDLGLKVLEEPAADPDASGEFANRIALKRATPEMSGRIQRDGQLVAELVEHRKLRQHTGTTIVIVSSSSHLRSFCAGCTEIPRGIDPVLPLGAVVYLLSLLPGVKLPLSALQRTLFDPGFMSKLSKLEKIALRVVQGSEEYDLFLARRGALKRNMMTQITTLALQQGHKDPDIVREKLERATEPESVDLLADIVHRAVDKLGRSNSERRIDQLKADNRSLQSQLEKERSSRRRS